MMTEETIDLVKMLNDIGIKDSEDRKKVSAFYNRLVEDGEGLITSKCLQCMCSTYHLGLCSR